MSEWVKIHLKPQLEICIQMGKIPLKGFEFIFFLFFISDGNFIYPSES